MAVLPIRTLGDPVLRTPCEPVTRFDEELSVLVQNMVETMFDVGGVGLAAPQVGISLRLFTYGIEGPEGEVGHVINPVVELGEEPQQGSEGCLSVPGLHAQTPRRNWARVSGVDMRNQPVVVEGEGLLARCLQHEADHLEGRLYIDRLEGPRRREIMKAIRAADFHQTEQRIHRERAGRITAAFGTTPHTAPRTAPRTARGSDPRR